METRGICVFRAESGRVNVERVVSLRNTATSRDGTGPASRRSSRSGEDGPISRHERSVHVHRFLRSVRCDYRQRFHRIRSQVFPAAVRTNSYDGRHRLRSVMPELVMGHFFKTQLITQLNPKFLDPTQPTKVFTRPNPTHHRHLMVWHIRLYRLTRKSEQFDYK